MENTAQNQVSKQKMVQLHPDTYFFLKEQRKKTGVPIGMQITIKFQEDMQKAKKTKKAVEPVAV